MESIKEVLMRRDGITEEEVKTEIEEAREQLAEYLQEGDMESAGDSLGTGIWDLVIGGLKSIGGILEMVVTAPNTIGNLVSGTLVDIGIPSSMGSWIGYLISGILWAVIIFTIYSSFLKGGKL